jgi:hypothetical protein
MDPQACNVMVGGLQTPSLRTAGSRKLFWTLPEPIRTTTLERTLPVFERLKTECVLEAAGCASLSRLYLITSESHRSFTRVYISHLL